MSTATIKLPAQWPRAVKVPVQARSRKSFESVIYASLRLLKQGAWDEITVHDITKEAHVSVGSFYGRFEDKETLLACLGTIAIHEIELLFQEIFDHDGPTQFERDLKRFIELALEYFQEHQSLIRTLYLTFWGEQFHKMPKPKKHAVPDIQETMRRVNARIAALLFQSSDCPRDIRSEKELGFVLNIALLTARDWMVFDTGGRRDLDILTNPIDLRLLRLVKGYFQQTSF